MQRLAAHGLRMCIDECDFVAEMERTVLRSHTLVVLTPAFVARAGLHVTRFCP